MRWMVNHGADINVKTYDSHRPTFPILRSYDVARLAAIAPPPTDPADWTEHVTADGTKYYHHKPTGTSSWTKTLPNRPLPPPAPEGETTSTSAPLSPTGAAAAATPSASP